MIPPPVFLLQTNENYFGLSFKKITAHRKLKVSVIHTLVVISLILSTFLLNRAEINCFEKVGVFTGGEEEVIIFGVYHTNFGDQY